MTGRWPGRRIWRWLTKPRPMRCQMPRCRETATHYDAALDFRICNNHR